MEQAMKMVELERIQPSKLNPRNHFDENSMAELVLSVTEKGVLQPILVRPKEGDGAFEIVCGERRYRAAKIAGLAEIPSVVREMNDQTAFEIMLTENVQRSDMHPLEEAEGYETLMKQYGYSGADQIADKVGKSRGYVYGRMKLLDLVPECRKMFYDGKLNPSVALLIARIPSELQKRAAKEIDGLSYRAAFDHIQRDYMLSLKDSGFAKDDTVCPRLGACISCTMRTGNQDVLFQDIKSADVCTNPPCFEAKRKEYVKRQTQAAQKKGQKLVDTKTAYPYGGITLANGYRSLDDKCPQDIEHRTYRELLKTADITPAVTVSPTGKVCEIVKEAAATKALNKMGVIKKPDGEKREADDKDKKQIFARSFEQAMAKILAKLSEDKDQLFWRIFAESVLARATGDTKFLMCKSRDPKIARKDVDAFLADYIKTLKSSDYPIFIAELLILPAWATSEEYTNAMLDLAAIYGININAIEEQVRQAIADENAAPVDVQTEDGKKLKVKMKGVNPEDRGKATDGLKKLGSMFGKGK